MAALISPGVQVTVTNESFIIPGIPSTVPLFFVATAEQKLQPDGLLGAAGTFESDVIRTITSLTQSLELYGVPNFLEDSNGQPLHGDTRNEYGLFALNQFLGLGNLAYVVRANVNLDDDPVNIQAVWDQNVGIVALEIEAATLELLEDYNATNNLQPSDLGFRTTVTAIELDGIVSIATLRLWGLFSFANSEAGFMDDHTVLPLDIFANGFAAPVTGTYLGFDGNSAAWVIAGSGIIAGEWSPAEANTFFKGATDSYKYTSLFASETTLGANDAARRANVVTALQASINSNVDIRSESFEFTLIATPGFHETADEMATLSVDVKEEAIVIADTPMNMTSSEVVAWAATAARQTSPNVAYYYPHGLASNLDGSDVFVAASGIALRTIAFSDDVSNVWFAPAGTQRGLVTGISTVGFVTGALGTATTFVESALNQGQRDNLYKFFTNINPIVFFPGRGIIVWGQKTSAPDASAMDRINVVRLIMLIRRSLRKNTMAFVFQPNDQLTRDNLKAMVDGFLGNLLSKRALFDFATVSDESNNTPTRVDRNELYIDIALKPTRAAEFIIIPIRIVATGASI